MIVRINIGLQNAIDAEIGTLHVARLLELATRDCASLESYRRVESAGGDWEAEPVLWAELEILPPTRETGSAERVDRFKAALAGLCTVLHEDAIAVAIVSPTIADGVIIWNPAYTGEKYDFNLDYFTE